MSVLAGTFGPVAAGQARGGGPYSVQRWTRNANRVQGTGLPPGMRRGQIAPQAFQDAQNVRAQQEADLQRALGMYGQAKTDYMNNPAWNQAYSQYQNLMGSGGPFGAQYVARQQGALKNQAAIGWQDQQRQIAESMARRGLGGAPTGYQTAQAQQQAQANLSGQLAGQEQWAAQANEAALAEARSRMAAMGSEQAQQAAALDAAAAALLGSTERTMLPWEIMLAASEVKGKNKLVW